MLKKIKHIVSILLVITVVFGYNCSFCAVPPAEGSFCPAAVIFLSEDFEEKTAVRLKGDYAVSEGSAILSGKSRLELPESGLAAETQISFRLFPDDVATVNNISFYAFSSSLKEKESLFDISFLPQTDSDRYCFSVNDDVKFFSETDAEWLDISVKLSMNEGFALITAKSPVGIFADNLRVNFPQGLYFSEVEFDGTDIKIDNIEVLRSGRFYGDSPVIYKSGNGYTASVKNAQNAILYFAKYSDKGLKDIVISPYSGNKYMDANLPDTVLKEGEKLAAFLWTEKLAPLSVQDILLYGDIDLTKLSVSGTLSADAQGVGVSFNGTCEYEKGKVRIYAYKGGDCVFVEEAQLSEGKYSYSKTELSPGLYSAEAFFVSDEGCLFPIGSASFFCETNQEGDTLIFAEKKQYYFKNGEKRELSIRQNKCAPIIENGEVFIPAEAIASICGVVIEKDENGAEVYYLDEKIASASENKVSEISGVIPLYSLSDVMGLFGYETVIGEKSIAITLNPGRNNKEDHQLFDDCILNEQLSTQNGWNSVSEWGSSSYSFGTQDGASYIEAVSNSFVAYRKELPADLNEYSIEVSFEAKKSADLVNNTPTAKLFFYKDNKFVMAAPSGVNENKNELTQDWQTFTYKFSTLSYKDYDCNKLRLLICSSFSGESGEEASGKIYFRNVRVTRNETADEFYRARIIPDKTGAWYNIGDTVRYTASDVTFGDFSRIRGVVCNLDGEAVLDKTISKNTFVNSGFSFRTENPGYYEITFYAVLADGRQYEISDCYTAVSDGELKAYGVSKHSFVVTEKTKPMAERNEMLMISSSARTEEEIYLADKIGFSGVRIHWIDWGSRPNSDGTVAPGFHTGENTFNWKTTDLQISNVDKYGFKNVWANVFVTPLWAVKDENLRSNKSLNSIGFYKSSTYAPKEEALKEGISAFSERYDGKITGIEFWNEPDSASFWGLSEKTNGEFENLSLSASEFAQMSVDAHSAISTADEDGSIEFISGGFSDKGVEFMGELAKNAEYISSIDRLTFHGRYSVASKKKYESILSEHGEESIPVHNGEGYYYNCYDAIYDKWGNITGYNSVKDYSVNNMVFLVSYFNSIKHNGEKLVYFSLFDSKTPEHYYDSNSVNTSYGMYRKNPSLQPYSGAVIAQTFFNLMGKDFSYLGEWGNENGQRAVLFNNDGSPMICVWNSKDETFALDGLVKACMSPQSEIIDFEGKKVSDTENMKARKMYYITNADIRDGLFSNSDIALSNSYKAPYYTCSTQ